MWWILGMALAGAGDATQCTAAFEHMKATSLAELQELPPAERKLALKAAAAVDDTERSKKFVAACVAGMVDAGCILKAKDTMGYVQCFGKPKPASTLTCDNKLLLEGASAVGNAAAEHRTALAAMALDEACRFSGTIHEALQATANMPLEQSRMMEMKAAAESAELWLELDCPTGPRAVAEASALSEEALRPALYDTCKLAGRSVFERDDFVASRGLILLPVLLEPALAAYDPTAIGVLLKALAGVK